MKPPAALDIAIAEAQRFLERTKALKDEIKANETRQYQRHSLPERAAAKRASMDLTRALAQFRKEGMW